MLIIDFVFFKEGRPYFYKEKSDVPAVTMEPVLVEPPEGEYFEADVLEVPELVIPADADEEGFDIIDDLLGFGDGEAEAEAVQEVPLTPEIPVLDAEDDQPVVLPPVFEEETKATSNKRGKIAIVIDDMGMNLKQSRAAIALPSEVTLAFLPYAEKIIPLTEQAGREGHEMIIHAPMEAMSSTVPLGSMALKSDMGYVEFTKEFNKMAASFDGYVGVNNHMGSKLTQSKEHMAYLMEHLKAKGLYFLDSRTIHTSVAADMAEAYGVPSITRDVFLDHEETEEYTANALKKVERMARENGEVIAIGHPKKITMQALQAWIPTLEGKGLDLVKVSEIIEK